MAVTAASFKARFTEFAAVPNGKIDALIAECAPQVAQMLARDKDPALGYLIAHMLTLEGEPGLSAGQGSAANRGPVTSYSVGDVSAAFASPAGSGGMSGLAAWYMQTTYGTQYYAYLRRNFTAVSVI